MSTTANISDFSAASVREPVIGLFCRFVRTAVRSLGEARAASELAELDDRTLADIGLRRGEILSALRRART